MLQTAGGSGDAAKRVQFLLEVAYDARNGRAFDTLAKAIEDANKRIVASATATAKTVGGTFEKVAGSGWHEKHTKKVEQVVKSRDNFFAQSNKNIERDEKSLDKLLDGIWNKRQANASKAVEAMNRAQALRTKETIRDAQLLGAQFGSLKDSALGFGKAISFASLIGERDMGKLTDRLLGIEAVFGGLKYGANVLSGARGVAQSLSHLGSQGPASFGRSVAEATGSQALGAGAWRLASSGAGKTAITGIGAAGGMALAAAPYAAIGAGVAAAGGLASYAYQGMQGVPVEERGWSKFVKNIPGLDPDTAESGLFIGRGDFWRRKYGVDASDEAIEKASAKRKVFLTDRDRRETVARANTSDDILDMQRRSAIGLEIDAAQYDAVDTSANPEQRARAWRMSAIAGAPDRGLEESLRGLFGQQNVLGVAASKNQTDQNQNSLDQDYLYDKLSKTEESGDPQAKVKVEWDIVKAKREGESLVEQEGQIALKRKQVEMDIAQTKAAALRSAQAGAAAEYNSRSGAIESAAVAVGMMGRGEQANIARLYDKMEKGLPFTPRDATAAFAAGIPKLSEYARDSIGSQGELALGPQFAKEREAAGVIANKANVLGDEARSAESERDQIEKDTQPIREKIRGEATGILEDILDFMKEIRRDVQDEKSRNVASGDSQAYRSQAHQGISYG